MYKIYNADNPPAQAQVELTEGELLLQSVETLKEMVAMYKGTKEIQEELIVATKETVAVLKDRLESISKAYQIYDKFLLDNVDLEDRYIDFLKELKANPEYAEYEEEINYSLSEYGVDLEEANQ